MLKVPRPDSFPLALLLRCLWSTRAAGVVRPLLPKTTWEENVKQVASVFYLTCVARIYQVQMGRERCFSASLCMAQEALQDSRRELPRSSSVVAAHSPSSHLRFPVLLLPAEGFLWHWPFFYPRVSVCTLLV